MSNLLDRREDGYELLEIDDVADLDMSVLVPMIDRAWAADYSGEPREDFNQAVLGKMLRGDSWFAVVAQKNGEPVGLEIALQRTLRVKGSALRAFYVTAFSVDPEHRRRGLGRWVLEGVNRCAFEKRGADLIFSSFHEGHAGSPTVQSTFDQIEGWAVERFHESDVWNLRLGSEHASHSGSARGRRVWCRAEDPSRLVGETERATPEGSPHVLPCLADVDRSVQERYEISFALEDSLREQFFSADGSESGCWFYRFEDGAEAFCCYNLLPLKLDQKRLLPVGQLQLVWGDVSKGQLEEVVRDACFNLAERGCFAVNLVDMGLVPESLLRGLGFSPLAEEHIVFAVRGPAEAAQMLCGPEAPFFLDFT